MKIEDLTLKELIESAKDSNVSITYSFYKLAYPWAYKTVILIPIAWLCRFFRIVFKSSKRAKSELKAIKDHKEDKEPSK